MFDPPSIIPFVCPKGVVSTKSCELLNLFVSYTSSKKDDGDVFWLLCQGVKAKVIQNMIRKMVSGWYFRFSVIGWNATCTYGTHREMKKVDKFV